MPVPPYTWQLDDYLTASRLNGELYRVLGSALQPNGIGWHAQKPFYQAAAQTGAGAAGFNIPAAGTWASFVTTTSPSLAPVWTVVSDTGGYCGSRYDPEQGGLLNGGSSFWGGGGNAATPGGAGLVISCLPFTGSANFPLELGISTSATNPVTGTIGGVYSGQTGINSCLDVVDLAASNTAWYLYGSGGTGVPATGSNDNSGTTARLQAAWLSAYPGNGTTVGSLPAPSQAYTNTTSLTSALMNAQIAATLNLLNMPPLLRVRGSVSVPTSVPNSTATVVGLGGPTYDTYSGWNGSTNTYTVPLDGAYLVFGAVNFTTSLGGPGGAVACSVKINTTTYSGPIAQALGTTNTGCQKVQVFDLHAGDTIQLMVEQFSGGTVSTSTSMVPLLVIAWLGRIGTLPGSNPGDADPTFTYAAGTPGTTVTGQLNSHLTNDLSLMTWRPYCMAYQTSAQTGITDSAITPVTYNTASGIVHGSAGDNYGGFSSSVYTAPVDGYYLLVQETGMATPTLTTNPRLRTGFQITPSGASAVNDFWQLMPERIGGSTGGGAAAYGIYYLRAGDQARAVIQSIATSSTTTSTSTAGNLNSHFEVVYLGG